MNKQWIAAYYPSDLIDNQRTKTLFCLLYDKVICHFPVLDSTCGGGLGVSNWFSDDPLVEEGVLELREELVLDEIDFQFSSNDQLGAEEEQRRFHDLNVTGMALRCCEQENAVPATDKANCPIPISILASIDLKRAASIQATALAIQSLDLVLPSFATMESHDVLEVREKLKEQLVPFRSAMFALAPKVRSGINSDASMDGLYKEAKYLVETDVLPRLAELKRRLALEQGTFWRKLIQKIGSNLPSLALKWVSGSGIAAAVDAAKLAGGVAAQAVENDKIAQELLSNGGLGYLMNVETCVAKSLSANQAVER